MKCFTEAYIYSDQPTTCPLCGTRSQVILNLSHTKDKTEVNKCLQAICGYEFVMQYDEDFETIGLLNKT